MNTGAELRQSLAEDAIVIAPGCYDALTALMIQQAGFRHAYVSGASVSFTRLGQPDLGLTTLTEVADTIVRIRERVDIGLIVDADTGFGNVLNVQRTVSLFERMGATAIQLEDQTLPKRCGHMSGKSLVSCDEMVGKLHAALDTRASDDTLIIARTDAVAVEGFDAAMNRANAYIEAGADVLFVEALRTPEQMRQVGETLGQRIALLSNMVEGGKTPITPAKDLESMGFSLVIYPGAMIRVIARAAQDYLRTLADEGSTLSFLDQMLRFDDVNRILGLDAMVEAGQRYDFDIRNASDPD
jgi:2-methylisocitrate lyase-like PEP mutase family enzyme